MSLPEESKAFTVTIFGTPITLKAAQSEDRIRSIAEYVDARMRQVAQRSQVISSLKVATMTALEIASELPQFQSGPQAPGWDERLTELMKAVDEALSAVDVNVSRQGSEARL